MKGKVSIHHNVYPYELFNTIAIEVQQGDVDVIKAFLDTQEEDVYNMVFFDAPDAKLCKITQEDAVRFMSDVKEAWACDAYVSSEVTSMFQLLNDVLSASKDVGRIGCIELVEYL